MGAAFCLNGFQHFPINIGRSDPTRGRVPPTAQNVISRIPNKNRAHDGDGSKTLLQGVPRKQLFSFFMAKSLFNQKSRVGSGAL